MDSENPPRLVHPVTQPASLQSWPELLRRAAQPLPPDIGKRLGAGGFVPAFAAACGFAAAPARTERPAAAEARLWIAAADPTIDADAAVASAVTDDEGPLLARGLYRTIEVWTESELCGLHAFWRLARERRRGDWQQRLESARDWHLENTQPDNATGRPWALHVFLLAGSIEGRMYAETLLHNALAAGAATECLIAAILHDAAREVEINGKR